MSTISDSSQETSNAAISSCLTPVGFQGCGCRPCRLCCGFLPAIKESTSTRLTYTLFLLLGTLLMCIMLTQDVQDKIIEIFPQYNVTCIILKAGENCDLLVGYMAVYRVSFGMAAFFFIMAFFTIGISTSDSCRSGLHNGLRRVADGGSRCWFVGTGVGTQLERVFPEDEEFCGPSDVSILSN